jgi:zinc protease
MFSFISDLLAPGSGFPFEGAVFAVPKSSMKSFLVPHLSAKRIVTVALLCLATTSVGLSQAAEPQREQLLNGLRILLWPRPNDPNVLLKLRIHSGAAFDTTGKSGTMALLGDILFPDAATHEYFTEEMGGRLGVTTTYDAIEITMQGRARDYDRIVDILRGALLTTQITPDNVAKIRAARIKKLNETKPVPADVADQAIASRLLGDFPYARPIGGTTETLARIERADLMLARERFVNANNATLAIAGGVDQKKAMRALRQLLGGWTKSNQIVPATFRQPEQPQTSTLIVDLPSSSPTAQTEIRLAARGLERSDGDFFAANVVAIVAGKRWEQASGSSMGSFFVRHDGRALPALFLMGARVNSSEAKAVLEAGQHVLDSLAATPVSSSELESAKAELIAQINRQQFAQDEMIEAWLDIDTYDLPSLSEQQRHRSAITAADLQRVAARLFRGSPIASVVVGRADLLKAQLSATQKVEVLGEVPEPKQAEQKAATDASTPKKKQAPIIIPKKDTNPFLKKKPASNPG